jgi:cephalosporin hydroxylase
MKSAVLFLVFNRPDTTKEVFNAIKAAKPPRLYVAADGIRGDRDGEAERCQQVRRFATDVDWPCELYTRFSEQNLGCKVAVSSAIDWFFSYEEEGIIVEDDVLPLASFFSFCDELLERYRYNDKVTMISGCNLMTERYSTTESYFFSRYCHIWGWATWRRSWSDYDVAMDSWPSWSMQDGLADIAVHSLSAKKYWQDIFNAMYFGQIDTWDYQWVYSCWRRGGLSVVPSNNLTRNIGFGADATHTIMNEPACVLEAIPQELSFPLLHPENIQRDMVADQVFDKYVFGYGQDAILEITKENKMSDNDYSVEMLHRNKVGKVSDKWTSYLPFYDALFKPYRYSQITMLEIGVQNGGSLETWATYFKEGVHFVGCDIDQKCAVLQYDDPRIHVVIGDANDFATLQSIYAIATEFDIVIDDGSHVSIDILNSFVRYFPFVKAGGLYIIEDTHSLYLDQFGGGVLNEFGAYAFFKKLIDIINFQFWREEISISTYLRTFFSLSTTPDFILEGTIESIEFRNSIVLIRKAIKPSHDKLGERIIVGESAAVQSWQGV